MREDGWRPWRAGVASALPGLATVIGHRGAAARAPENTLAGLRKAKELGADWVEFDVMLSGDGVPVLIHDETLQRTTTGRGRVARHTADEIRSLDAGAWFAPEFAGERVPTLAEAVALLLELGLNANVEIKPSSGQAQVDRRGRGGLLRRLWPQDGPRLLLSSFERKALACGAARGAGASRAGCWRSGCRPTGRRPCRRWAARPCIWTIGGSARRKLRELAAADVPVLLYTVNDAQRARELLAAGAVAVITDVPDLWLSSGASTPPGGPGS